MKRFKQNNLPYGLEPQIEILINSAREEGRRIGREEGLKKAFLLCMSIPCLTLRDRFDFGKKRLERFSKDLVEKFNDMIGHYFTPEDAFEALYDETGFKIIADFEEGSIRFETEEKAQEKTE